jgi:hypothetical protein
MSDKDVDAQFADIVAHWDEVPSLPDPPRAAAPEARPNPVNPPPTHPFVVWRGADQDPSARDFTAPAEPVEPEEGTEPRELRRAPEEIEEHYEPGPTAPLPPQEDHQFWGIIVGLVAGPLLLLWIVLFRPAVSGWWTLAALGLTVGGFALLVMRQPHTRIEDDPDDGARL